MPTAGQAVLRAVGEHETTTRFLASRLRRLGRRHQRHTCGRPGYVTKNISGPDLVDAIYRIAAGDVVFSPRLAGFVSTPLAPHKVITRCHRRSGLDQLTARERQVLRLIARGYSYKDVAKELTISTKTVESHVSSVLRKLQLSSRYQLSHWASERHLN